MLNLIDILFFFYKLQIQMIPTIYHYKIHDCIWKSVTDFRSQILSEGNIPYFVKNDFTPIKILQFIYDVIDSYDDDYNEWWIATIENQPLPPWIFHDITDIYSTFDLHPSIFDDLKEFISNFEDKTKTLVHYLLVQHEIDKISWKTMRYVLQYYITDSSNFMSKINELNFSEEELREKLELSDSEINEDSFIIDSILKQRYIDGRAFHIVNGEVKDYYINMTYAEGIGPSQWWVENITFTISPDIQYNNEQSESDLELETSDEELYEAIVSSNRQISCDSKIITSIKQIYSIVEEDLQEHITEGDYLQLSNILKTIYDKSI